MLSEPRAFTVRAKGLARELHTSVGVCPAFRPGSGGLHPEIKAFKGLWDTGATGSVITQKVIDECQLKPIGMAQVYHAQGTSMTEVYAVNLFVPPNIGIPVLNVTKGDLNGTDVLIGMDVISQGDFALTHKNGDTCFSFCIPSREDIDFEKSKPIQTSHKIPRNDPCPCKSGKKYKHCCGVGK